MDQGQKQTEEFMRKFAGAVHETIKETVGDGYAFTFILWGKGDTERTNYISNGSNREQMIKALRSTVMRLEAGYDQPVDTPEDPNQN